MMIFKPSDVWFRADFYLISDIWVKGTIVRGASDSTEIVLTNNSYGFSLDGLRGNDNKTFIINRTVKLGRDTFCVKFYIGHILNYEPKGSSFSKFIANSEHPYS